MLIHIFKGWSNMMKESLGLLDPETKAMAEKRLKICETCPLRSKREMCSAFRKIEENGKSIRGCGCDLKAAATVKAKKCVRGLWE